MNLSFQSRQNSLSKNRSYYILASFLVLLQITGSTVGTLAFYANLLLAGIVILKRDIHQYGILLILLLPSIALRNIADLSLSNGILRTNQYGEATWLVLPINSMVATVSVGVDLYTPFIASFVATGILLLRCINTTSFKRNNKFVVPDIIIYAWILALAIAFLSTFYYYLEDGNTKITGIKILLGLSGFFWGIISSYYSRVDTEISIKSLMRFSIIGLILFLVGAVQNQLLLLLPGFAGSLSVFFLRKSKPLLLLLSISVGLILLTQYTFTTAFSFILGSILSIIFIFPKYLSLMKSNIYKFRFLLGTLMILFPFIVFSTVQKIDTYSSENIFIKRLFDKIFADRYNVWKGVYNLISEPPYIFVPSGRNILVEHYEHGHIKDISFGAHNFPLECIRQLGWISGAIAICIAIYVLLSIFKALRQSKDLRLMALMSGYAASSLIATITGHFLASDRIGFFWWSYGGLLVGLSLRQQIDIITNIRRNLY
ncbi:hypothetical protein Lepto7375DRAFT_2259 [Leptolyngbya sp. PCC 7375]|nr:hypothetical protein Lepto7375DRAFT_2259 [Leptolyngbya sp. PCC 7375]